MSSPTLPDTRRAVILGGGRTLLAVCSAILLSSRHNRSIDWAVFIDRVTAIASNSRLNEAEMVDQVSALTGVLDWHDASLRRILGVSAKRLLFPVFSDIMTRLSFQLRLITLERRNLLPLHDHPRMAGVTICVKAKVRVRQFDVLRNHQLHGRLIQCVSDRELNASEYSSFTSDRANLHVVDALAFSQMIDVFLPAYDERRQSETRIYRVEETTNPSICLAI